jgi:cell wall assembly regulator SMI1/predicted DNA-binding WGR domain protein
MSSRPSVAGLLRRLGVAWGARRGFPTIPRGATSGTLARFSKSLRGLGVAPPKELLQILAWHDGSGRRAIDGYHVLLSTKGIVAAKRMLDGMIDEFEDGWRPGEWWNAGWLPFLEEEGNLLCVDLVGSFGGAPGQILSFRTHDSARKIVHRSLGDWLHTITVLWEGVAEGTSEDDAADAFYGKGAARIRKRLNPGYPRARSAKAKPAERPPKGISSRCETFTRGAYEWQITRAGALVQTMWGRAYSRSRKTKTFDSDDEASRFYDRQVAAKLREGYRRVGTAAETKDTELLAAAGRHAIKASRGA